MEDGRWKMFESDESYFTLNGKPYYIYSGEIHYFRIEPSKWKIHLNRALDAGLNTVSTYIPWSWHEYEEGKFDFNGETHPGRNLVQFLKEVKDSGLYLIVRIGPFSNAELKGEGIPLWLTKNYPEVYSKGEGIVNLPHIILISYINPTFRSFVRKWYDKVIIYLAPVQATKGGNIILTQLCNEIGMIQWVNKRGDESYEATGMYRGYLKEKYENIDRLKEVYPESNFTDFEEIKQPSDREKYGWQDFWDWADFYRTYFADYYEYLYNLAYEKGINTPVIANIPQFIDFDVRGRGLASPMTTSFYRYIPEKIKNIVFGGAYQMKRLDYENFHDVCITTQVVKALTNYSNPVMCAELQTGIMRDRPKLYATDVELNLKTSLASGVNGVNCYMFSGGENPDNIGMFGKYHKWQAPVSEEGNTDDKYEVLKEHGEFLKTFGNIIAQTKPLFQTAFGIYPPLYATEFLDNFDIESLTYARDRYFYDGIARLLNLASTNFRVIDLMKDELNPAKLKTLLVFMLSFMDEDLQKKLVNYVKNGGKLLLYPEIPENDLSGKTCKVLMDELGVKLKEKISPSIINFNGKECFVEGEVSIVEATGDYKTIATAQDKVCALSKDCEKGKFVFIGAPMPHYYDYHIDIMNGVIQNELNIKSNIDIVPKDIIGMMRVSPAGSFLFLMNYHDRKHNVNININVEEYGINLSEGNICLNQRSSKILPVNVEVNDNIKILFSTVEILTISMDENTVKLKVKGCPGEMARILLNINGTLKINSRVLKKKVQEIEI